MTDISKEPTVDELQSLLDGATSGPWVGLNMIHADHGGQMTPDELGEYVSNAVKMGDASRFLFVSGEHDDGSPCDVCHTGNGPKGPYNTALIALAPDLAKRVIAQAARLEELEAQCVEVKPLVWVDLSGPIIDGNYEHQWQAGEYEILMHVISDKITEYHLCANFYINDECKFKSLDAAKQAAQEHHNARILSVITARPESEVRADERAKVLGLINAIPAESQDMKDALSNLYCDVYDLHTPASRAISEKDAAT